MTVLVMVFEWGESVGLAVSLYHMMGKQGGVLTTAGSGSCGFHFHHHKVCWKEIDMGNLIMKWSRRQVVFQFWILHSSSVLSVGILNLIQNMWKIKNPVFYIAYKTANNNRIKLIKIKIKCKILFKVRVRVYKILYVNISLLLLLLSRLRVGAVRALPTTFPLGLCLPSPHPSPIGRESRVAKSCSSSSLFCLFSCL